MDLAAFVRVIASSTVMQKLRQNSWHYHINKYYEIMQASARLLLQ
jgi:hypothetical protein